MTDTQNMTDTQLATSQFQAGSVMSRGFAIFFRNFVPFMLLAGLVFSPLIVYTALIDLSLDNPNLVDAIQTWMIVVIAGSIPLGMLLSATLVYGTFQQLRGQPASIGECLSYGIGRIFPVLGVALLAGLCIILGLVLLVIPGVIVATMLWVAIPVAVVERPGIVASLRRSTELTSGNRWRILGILVVLNVIERVMSFIIENAVLENIALYLAMSLVIAAFIAAIDSVITAVGYHDLRVAKEGVDTSQIASVFD